MSQFFNLFPTVAYDINKDSYSNYQLPTNIFMRIGIIRETLENISSYYTYNIKDGETPEVLADQVYKNSEAHWVIMMANQVLDPSYDWPLNYDKFGKYIANKYRTAAGGGSLSDNDVIAWSQTNTPGGNNIFKYEKVVERTNTQTLEKNVWRYEVNYDKETMVAPSNVPYDYYLNLSSSGTYNNYNISGETIQEKIYGTYQTIWDHEQELNESKRTIKVIKADYYGQIVNELRALTGSGYLFNRTLK